jgi:hypothetical protein
MSAGKLCAAFDVFFHERVREMALSMDRSAAQSTQESASTLAQIFRVPPPADQGTSAN